MHGHPADRVASGTEIPLFLATLPAWIVIAKLYRLYERDEERTDHSTADEIASVFHMVTVGVWLFFAGAWLTKLASPSVPKLLVFWALAISIVTVARALARALARRSDVYLQNTVIVGAGETGQLIARKLLKHPEYGINLVGFVDSSPKPIRRELRHVAQLGRPERLPAIVRVLDVERVIVAFSGDTHEESLDLIRTLRDLDVQVDIVPRLYELLDPGVSIHTVEGLALLGLAPLKLSRSSQLLKRSVDVAVALCGLCLLAPVFALVGLLIKRSSPGPVFFRQTRMGSGDRTFRIYKFRTMAADADVRKDEVAHLNVHARNGGDARMFKVENDPRVTRIGYFLRRYSLDELPQLINVLRGEMSLVGPRPLILDEDRHVGESWARRRLELKPGMTGLWQVLGRSAIAFEEMVRLDYRYVTTWSLWNDFHLLFRTIPIVARGSGGSF
jgi:exopolysaccharide biosynthesis polyprenyl glycosylphosphotransferase